MQPDHKNRANLLDLVKWWLKTRHNKPGNAFAGMIQRLDGPVAGLVTMARTSKAASRLSAQIRQGLVEKNYLAVVQGRLPRQKDRLENELIRDGRKSRIVRASGTKSQHASLTYRCIASRNEISLVEIGLETGRRHQIRVQLAAIGCPILGDVTYGAQKALPHGRIALLARRIEFDHPTRKERMVFESPTPEGWPWAEEEEGWARPLWTIEEYEAEGLALP